MTIQDGFSIDRQRAPPATTELHKEVSDVALSPGRLRSALATDTGQIHEPINGSQQMILRHMIVYRELIKQCTLRFLLWSQHRNYSLLLGIIESAAKAQIKRSS